MRRIAVVAFAFAVPLFAHAATFTVNQSGDAADATPGNGVCATAGAVCTLRAALQEANALAGVDTINFAIGSGPQTIAVSGTALPISSSLTIDATTQPGSGSSPRILLDGANAVTSGFDFGSVGSLNVTIRGLAIGRFTEAGIKIYESASTVRVDHCYIGVGLDGVTALPNGDGIFARINDFGGSTLILGDATGGGNVLSGNNDMGLEIVDNGGAGAKLGTLTVQGNIIGLGADGLTQVANLSGGVRTNLQFGTITFGGSAAARNILSGNGGSGYQPAGFLQADTFTFSFNYVGVAQDGITARGNNGTGAAIVAKVFTVDSNIIASNAGSGLTFSTSSQPSPLRGNRIGVALDGSPRGNGGAGITWASGTDGLIGGPSADQNLIAYNGGAGVRVSGGQCEVDVNSIHDNGGLGIDIGVVNTVDANDANDADTGSGNDIQNRPVISAASRGGGVTFINGSLSSAPSSPYRIRLFSNSVADPSGFGEGETFLGEISVTTNAGGSVSFSFSTPGAPAGSFVTATATSASGDTSEFSNAFEVLAPPQFRFSAASGVVPESGIATLTIERVNNIVGPASVNWATVPGTATSADFVPASGTANFASGQISRTFNVTITPDTLDEIDETFSVTLSSPSAGGEIGSPASETLTITDDDPSPTVSIANAATNEGNAGSTPLTFNVTLSAVSGQTVTVDYVTSNGTAVAGSDYAAAAGTLTFAPGQTAKTITVQLVGDTATELDESFSVTLTNPTNIAIASGSATGTITNDDGSPSITIGDVAVVEGDSGTSTALFTLALSGPTASTVTVNWSTSSGTAIAGTDYESASGTATFAPNVTTATIAVTIDGDTLVENNETFFVDLSGPSGATLADAQGGGTIADDDGTPSLSIIDPAVVEGATATFTVTLAPASSLPVTVAYATSDVSAVAGSDYASASSTLTFAAGETSKTVDVPTVNDALAESSEQFRITLSAPSGATIGDALGTATIIDDDGAPRVTIGNASLAEGNGGASVMSFTVDLSHASASPISVGWSTANGTAFAGSDYASGAATLAFAPGEVSKTIAVTILGDTIIEPDEIFFVRLNSATNATITDNEGAGTITNDDGGVTISINNVSANEDTGTFTFNVTLNAASSEDVSVSFTTSDLTATSGIDYSHTAGSLLFFPGETVQTISINVLADATFEPNETFRLNLLAATNATIADAQGVGTIVNDDPAPAIPSISIAPASASEGNAGTSSMTFAVTLDVATINTVSVNYTTGGGSASAGADYVATNGTLMFAPGVTTQNIVVPVVGDVLVEGNETLVVTLIAPSNATFGTSSATGTIVDDDPNPAVPSISISGASVTEGNAGSASLTFAVQLSVSTIAPVTVDYATGGGTATAGTDYVATSGTLTFAPGVTTQNVIVPVIGDALVEGDETLAVTLTSPSNATLGSATATGTILDDDSAPAVPSISISGASVAEGNAGSTPLTFAVQLSAPTVATVTVSYATGGGTATAGTDYVATTGTLTFAPGVTMQNINVPLLGDIVVEGNETFTVTLTSPSNATLGSANATGTIVDDDSLPFVPSISIGDVTQFEGDAGATLFAFPVTLDAPGTAPVSVAWTTVAGTANAASDFVAANGTVVFMPGMTSQSIPIAVNGDDAFESDETFSVQLAAPANATLADGNALGTIRNDDHRVAAPPVLTAAALAVAEGNDGETQALVTLTLSSRAPSGASVRWMTRAGTATSALDFIEASGRATFGTNTTVTIPIAILGDHLDESDETFVLELFDANGLTLGDDRVTVTILDDDNPPAPRAIVLAVGSLRGNANSRFGTAVQMANIGDSPASGSLVIRPAGTSDPARDTTIPYALAAGELRSFGDLLAENGLEGLGTLDVLPSAGATPAMTVRIYDDASGHGTTGFTLPVVTPDAALGAGDQGILFAPDSAIAMRFNIGVRTLEDGAALSIETRDRYGAIRHNVTREFGGNWFNQIPGNDFAGIALNSGDYLVIHVTRGSAILYGATIDNVTNDPSVQVLMK